MKTGLHLCLWPEKRGRTRNERWRMVVRLLCFPCKQSPIAWLHQIHIQYPQRVWKVSPSSCLHTRRHECKQHKHSTRTSTTAENLESIAIIMSALSQTEHQHTYSTRISAQRLQTRKSRSIPVFLSTLSQIEQQDQYRKERCTSHADSLDIATAFLSYTLASRATALTSLKRWKFFMYKKKHNTRKIRQYL